MGTGRGELAGIVLTADEIAARVQELGKEISLHYRDSEILVVGVLKGAIFFLADLLRTLECPLAYDVLRIASYGSGTRPQGVPELRYACESELAGRHVLLVEDIVDTGHTLARLHADIGSAGVLSLRSCVLLDKPQRRQVEVPLDWVGFRIPDQFVVGYGLDLAERHRNLPFIAHVREQ